MPKELCSASQSTKLKLVREKLRAVIANAPHFLPLPLSEQFDDLTGKQKVFNYHPFSVHMYFQHLGTLQNNRIVHFYVHENIMKMLLLQKHNQDDVQHQRGSTNVC